MLLLSLLALPSVSAVPLAPCKGADANGGDLLDKGGLLVWESASGSGQPVAIPWGEVCSVAYTPDAPVPSIVAPEAGLVLNAWKEIDVRALAGNPDTGLGRCAWWIERNGTRTNVPVRALGTGTTGASQAWVGTSQVCEGTVQLPNIAPGEVLVGVTATDAFGDSGEASVAVRLNAAPTLGFASPEVGTAYLPGEGIAYTVQMYDDVVVPAGEVITVELTGDDIEPVEVSCTTDGHGNCSGTVTAPETPGAYALTAWWIDEDGKEGSSPPRGIVVNDLPGVFITSPVDGAMLEAGVGVDVVISVVDATAAEGDPVELWVEHGTKRGSRGTCTLDAFFSCAVPYVQGVVGEYRFSATYTDRYFATVESEPVGVIVNDTPVVSTDLVADRVVDPGVELAVSVEVTDASPATGEVYAFVSDGSTSTTYGPFLPDARGDATAELVLPVDGSYEVSFAFTDAYGVSAETTPVVVIANNAPTVVLDDPISGGIVEVPVTEAGAGDPFALLTYGFTTGDDGDPALTVTPARDLGAYVTCAFAADGVGAWTCDLDTSGWEVGPHEVFVDVFDGVETTTDGFVVMVTDGPDYDYDGDGVTEAAWIALGDGVGDCEPYDANAHGASIDPMVPAAPEVCDELDNDCDGTVNDGLPDEGGSTIEGAEAAMGTVVTTTNGGYVPDVTFEGSLHNAEDVDWWYFEVGEDDATDRRNVSFTLTLSVPESEFGEPEGEWAVGVWVSDTPSATDALAPAAMTGPSVNCALTSGDGCNLTWTVAGVEGTIGEFFWWLEVGVEAWVPGLCTEDAALPSYTLTVLD